MAIEVGTGPIDIYQGVPFSTVEVDPNTVVPEGQVDVGNLFNPINITLGGEGSSSQTSGIIRLSTLVSGSSIRSGYFYEYNDVIYRATTAHTWNGTFNSNNFIPQGARLEHQSFSITNSSTTVLTLTTSNVGRILNLTVNGIQFKENLDFIKGGSGNKTLTFSEVLPWDTNYGPTYVEVDVIPDSTVSWGNPLIIDKDLIGQTFSGQFNLSTGGEVSYKKYSFNNALTPTVTSTLTENTVCRINLDAGSSASLVVTNLGSARIGSDTFTPNKQNELLIFVFPDGTGGALVISHSIKVLN